MGRRRLLLSGSGSVVPGPYYVDLALVYSAGAVAGDVQAAQ